MGARAFAGIPGGTSRNGGIPRKTSSKSSGSVPSGDDGTTAESMGGTDSAFHQPEYRKIPRGRDSS